MANLIANRLSEDPSTKVLVLEAGRPDWKWDIFIHMPAGLSTPLGNKLYDWKYESEPEPHMNGRKVYHGRGKVLGGTECSIKSGWKYHHSGINDCQRRYLSGLMQYE